MTRLRFWPRFHAELQVPSWLPTPGGVSCSGHPTFLCCWGLHTNPASLFSTRLIFPWTLRPPNCDFHNSVTLLPWRRLLLPDKWADTIGNRKFTCSCIGVGYFCKVCRKVGWLVEWGFYALSASKAIFRARTYNCNLFSPVMMIRSEGWKKIHDSARPCVT